MKIQYFAETDTLAIGLTENAVVETEMVTDDLILDYDETRKIVAITIDNYSKNVDLPKIQTLISPLEIGCLCIVKAIAPKSPQVNNWA